jgi:putative DNA primase/helicase
MNIAEVARAWREAGVAVLPILANGTKRPAVRWAPYQVEAPTLGQVDLWWGNGREYGLALICGQVSGNLEMLELEGRVVDADSLTKVEAALDSLGGRDVWEFLNSPAGYVEWSPSGGLHFLYRVSDHEVPGNTKIAKDAQRLVLVETRGEGGYVIAAPTSGLCHPTGEPWTLVTGMFGQLPTLTWAQREILHRGLRLALDWVEPRAVAVPTSPGPLAYHGPGVTPGDDFEARTDWADILEPHGWQLESRHGRERYWTRPGKETRDGASATTGRDPARDRLYVFSTSTCFAPEHSYTKFGAYALINFNGDHSAAARELVRLGYGERRDPAEGIIAGEPLDPGPVPRKTYSLDEVGNADRLADKAKGRFHYVAEEKQVVRWDGRVWTEDFDGALWREAIRATEDMARQGSAIDDELLVKWAKSSRSKAKLNSATEMVRMVSGFTRRVTDFNPHRHLLNVQNGVLNLRTMEFVDHDPALLMTRLFGASYDPDAKCPAFESFMADVLPDEEMRGYVQRALGYSLLGDVDQRAMFLIYGPSGTGKSTLMETMRALFGDYGTTAAAGTFRARGRDSAPTNDLHDLRGKRFVTTSETAESATYDEDTLKRLTGRDRIRTRELYQSNQEWTPECTLWLATNHPPKFTSDDDAIWKRAKLIPFLTQFGEAEVADLARVSLIPEAAGILNWLLAGLADYQARGLDEPEQVRVAASEQRRQADSVARFLDDREADGILIEVPEVMIKVGDLHMMYLEWARTSGERGVGTRRFMNRLTSLRPQVEHMRINGASFLKGISRSAVSSLLGTMLIPQPDP